MKLAHLAIAQWIPETEKWVAQMPAAIPSWVKEPEVIADLVKGDIVERDGEFFRAHVLADTGIILPQPFVRTVQ